MLIVTAYFFYQQQLTRKNLMAKNLKRLKKQLEREQGKLEAAKYPKIYWFSISSFSLLNTPLFGCRLGLNFLICVNYLITHR